MKTILSFFLLALLGSPALAIPSLNVYLDRSTTLGTCVKGFGRFKAIGLADERYVLISYHASATCEPLEFALGNIMDVGPHVAVLKTLKDEGTSVLYDLQFLPYRDPFDSSRDITPTNRKFVIHLKLHMIQQPFPPPGMADRGEVFVYQKIHGKLKLLSQATINRLK